MKEAHLALADQSRHLDHVLLWPLLTNSVPAIRTKGADS